jgi:uncharacterized protein with PIN domain
MKTIEEEKIEYKQCPSCNRKTPISECKKIESRSSGKTTISWRCNVCYEMKLKKNRDSIKKRLFTK